MQKSQERRAMLAKVHIAKKELALDDDSYRAILGKVCQVQSSADVDAAGLDALLAHFKTLGWINKKTAGRPRVLSEAKAKDSKLSVVQLMGKIEALLADSGKPWDYARAIAKNRLKVDRLEFATAQQLHKLVGILAHNQAFYANKSTQKSAGD